MLHARSCRIADIASGMYSNYAARVLGMRFLSPVWFVDSIALTRKGDVIEDERDVLGAALQQLLMALGFKPFCELSPNPPSALPSRRKLTYEEALIFATRQLMYCERCSVLAPGAFDRRSHPTEIHPEHASSSDSYSLR